VAHTSAARSSAGRICATRTFLRIDWTTPIQGFARLERANLEHAHAARTRFAFAKLAHAHLQEATLRHAQLDGAHLRSADLRGEDLRNATLTNARLQGAELLGANLRGADLRQARGVDVAGTRGTPSHLPNERCPRVQPEPWAPAKRVCLPRARRSRPTGPRSRSSSRHAHAPI
jgi:pentapeptide repeat protein